MFLIFVLNRPDVWPVDDLGFREGLNPAFKLAERPTASRQRFGRPMAALSITGNVVTLARPCSSRESQKTAPPAE